MVNITAAGMNACKPENLCNDKRRGRVSVGVVVARERQVSRRCWTQRAEPSVMKEAQARWREHDNRERQAGREGKEDVNATTGTQRQGRGTRGGLKG